MESSTPISRSTRSAGRHGRRLQSRRVLASRSPRAAVAEAFRRVANGLADRAAYASSVAFYRSRGYEWSKKLA
jgi:hypothetical protein